MSPVRIEPTVGRSLLYFHRAAVAENDPPAEIVGPEACILCDVNEDGTINVCHFSKQGETRAATNVLLLQDEDAEPDEDTLNWCEWMPFQKGQAAKTEQLQREAVANAQSGAGSGPSG